jgi:hypothetical protein
VPASRLVAHSVTKFIAPWGANVEFELDGDGTVKRAVVEHGPFLIPLEPK